MAYFLSRLTVGDECMPIEDSFPNEYMFAISAHSLWYTYIAKYLAIGIFLQY